MGPYHTTGYYISSGDTHAYTNSLDKGMKAGIQPVVFSLVFKAYFAYAASGYNKLLGWSLHIMQVISDRHNLACSQWEGLGDWSLP